MKREFFKAQSRLDVNVGGIGEDKEIEGDDFDGEEKLKTSESLSFLHEKKEVAKIIEDEDWSLYNEGKKLEPLVFSNGKNQKEVVKEICELIKEGKKVILLKGMCGTGKSAIALNIARNLGKAAIVVPVKGLQRQYEEDYSDKKYVIKKNGERMKIASITGRDNHDSLIKPGASCADPYLPDTIKITDKNLSQIREYYMKNPLIKSKVEPDVSKLRRISIAPSNPYWSPIVPSSIELPLRDAKKKRYTGVGGNEFIFYHRKLGCSYYDQYQAYLDADVIIFNSAKYKIEMATNKKPETEVDIIDEADEFLDNFSTQDTINLTRLASSLNSMNFDSEKAEKGARAVIDFIELEEKNKRALGVDEKEILKVKDTQIFKILSLALSNSELQAELSLDEVSYANKLVEVSESFKEFLDDTYVTFSREDRELIVSLVTTNLSKKFAEIIEKNKALVLMSGTLHSAEVLKNIFGIEDFSIVEAENKHQGSLEICRTGEEFDCKYSNFASKKHSRKDYLAALEKAMERAVKPVLVHVNAFEDLPSEAEIQEMQIIGLMSRERLYNLQKEDKTGKAISIFKAKLSDSLFTTKCSRGVDFPGDTCNSVVFTKYPNPNVNGLFWRVLQKTHSQYFWDFYRDKARREFLQRVYRALRSPEDRVTVLSPDSRVLDAVRDMQLSSC